MNDSRTSGSICAEAEPTTLYYELTDRFGMRRGLFPTLVKAEEAARRIWPSAEQGDGWDVGVLRCPNN